MLPKMNFPPRQFMSFGRRGSDRFWRNLKPGESAGFQKIIIDNPDVRIKKKIVMEKFTQMGPTNKAAIYTAQLSGGNIAGAIALGLFMAISEIVEAAGPDDFFSTIFNPTDSKISSSRFLPLRMNDPRKPYQKNN